MEVYLDVRVEPASVRKKRTSSMWEERADQIIMEVCLDTTGECCECDAGEVLGRHVTVSGIRSEPTQTVISTKKSHKAKRDEVQQRVVTHEFADAMPAPEHCASTPRTRAPEVGDQQNDVEVPCTSASVMRYVICVLS